MMDEGSAILAAYSLVKVETFMGRIHVNNNERSDLSDRLANDAGQLLFHRVWAGGKRVDIPVARIHGEQK